MARRFRKAVELKAEDYNIESPIRHWGFWRRAEKQSKGLDISRRNSYETAEA